MRLILFIVSLLLLLPGCGPIYPITSNGEIVLVRSPQPSADDLQDLAEEYRIKTVLNLRGEKPQEDWYLEEAESCENLSLTLVNNKTAGYRAPHLLELKIFFGLVTNKENYPILIHCQGGIHRTGAYVALYRIYFQGWTTEQAIAELESNYFDWSITDRSRLKNWIKAHENSILGGLLRHSLTSGR